jgi:hypothetical protein
MFEKKSTKMELAGGIISAIWSTGKEVYNGVKEEVVSSIEEETISRVKKELGLGDKDKLDMSDFKIKKLYDYHHKIVTKEAKELGLKGGLILFGLGWFF